MNNSILNFDSFLKNSCCLITHPVRTTERTRLTANATVAGTAVAAAAAADDDDDAEAAAAANTAIAAPEIPPSPRTIFPEINYPRSLG